METSRARLRRLQPSDYSKMRELEADSEVMRFTPSRVVQSEAQTQTRLLSQIEKQRTLEPFGVWLAEEKSSESFLGWFMLIPERSISAELGFMLVRPQWQKGFATEIAKTLIDFAHAQGIRRITATTNIGNAGSMRALEKLGFLHAKNIWVPEKVHGGEIELKVYELLG